MSSSNKMLQSRYLCDNLIPYTFPVVQACSHVLLEVVFVSKEKAQKMLPGFILLWQESIFLISVTVHIPNPLLNFASSLI